uniref:Uncharacterized protein n=1 Tax=Cacopsylla melanoneura TaxID=428564 RepID=A0A8D9FG24_9HEMI
MNTSLRSGERDSGLDVRHIVIFTLFKETAPPKSTTLVRQKGRSFFIGRRKDLPNLRESSPWEGELTINDSTIRVTYYSKPFQSAWNRNVIHAINLYLHQSFKGNGLNTYV